MGCRFADILIIRTGGIGDIVHGLPALCALRRRFPAARISWLVDGRYRSLLDGHPALDEVCAAPAETVGFGRIAEDLWNAWLQYGLAPDLRRRRFDCVLDFQGLLRTGWLSALAGCRTRIGRALYREGAPLFYSRCVRTADDGHAIREYLDLARHLGAAADVVDFGLRPTEEAMRKAEERLAAAGVSSTEPLVAILPKSSRAEKDWTTAGYAAVVARLHQERGLRCVLMGGAREESACRAVADASAVSPAVVVGQPLAVSTAILARVRLLVGGDSGPAHVAAALGRRVVAVFGPTDPVRFAPWGNRRWVVREPTGLSRLSSERVLERIAAALDEPTDRAGTARPDPATELLTVR